MTALLLALLGVLTLLLCVTVGVAALAVRLSRRVGQLEARLAASSDAVAWSGALENHASAHLEARPSAEYVITHLGEPEQEPEVEAVPAVAPGLFADLVLRETVVQTASLFHGVRRALSPENRNRIRFEMRREVKRSRKQRRLDVREARREWEARQRAAMADDRASTAA
jgi:uncharacterized SAM-binding protein YcdF (DUF218 family)